MIVQLRTRERRKSLVSAGLPLWMCVVTDVYRAFDAPSVNYYLELLVLTVE